MISQAVFFRRSSRRSRRGLSLLEVILAVAILGIALALIGELVRMGTRHAEEARFMTIAQLVCESKLEEVAAGVMPPESTGMMPYEEDPRWMYEVSVVPLEQPDLVEVQVTVQEAASTRMVPLSFSLVRWMIDPALQPLESEFSTTVTAQ